LALRPRSADAAARKAVRLYDNAVPAPRQLNEPYFFVSRKICRKLKWSD
jgi:hypothetical protein